MPETVAGNLILFNKGPLMGDAEMRCGGKACLSHSEEMYRTPRHVPWTLDAEASKFPWKKPDSQGMQRNCGVGEKHHEILVML